MEDRFHDKLKQKMDNFVHLVYDLTKDFPKEELYGTTSQLRRAAISTILNYIEGFARKRKLVKINFFETSFGSLKESCYLLIFADKRNWIKDTDKFQKAQNLSGEIAAMLWKTIEGLTNETE